MKLREVSLAVSDMNGTAGLLSRLLQVDASPAVEVTVPPVEARFVSLRAGETSIAIMESTGPGSPIARFLAARGEALFSITFEVDDIHATMAHFRACGAEFVLDEPLVLSDYSTGFARYRECLVNFTRPSTTARIVIEVQELRR